MTGLHIPDAARAVFAEMQRLPLPNSSAVDWGAVDRDIRSISAPVVADAFRRFADDNRGKWNTAARVMIALRAEADKLDGGTS